MVAFLRTVTNSVVLQMFMTVQFTGFLPLKIPYLQVDGKNMV